MGTSEDKMPNINTDTVCKVCGKRFRNITNRMRHFQRMHYRKGE